MTSSQPDTRMVDAERPYLAWNIKTSFRGYVQASDGRVVVTGDALERHDEFVFAFDPTGADRDGEHRFRGSVRFTAHGGAMDVLIADPWIHVDGADVRLSIAGTEATRTAGRRVFLARVQWEASTMEDGTTRAEGGATLLSEGAAVFDFNYAPGTELAPVRASIPA